MIIRKRNLSSRFLMLPNSVYFFGPPLNEDSNLTEIVYETRIENTCKLYFLRVGAIGFEFDSPGPYASIDILEQSEDGQTPQEVMDNHEEIVAIQLRRIQFTNFVSAAIFGRISAQRHCALVGARFARLDEISAFQKHDNALLIPQRESKELVEAINQKIATHKKQEYANVFIDENSLGLAIAFLRHLIERGNHFQQTNVQSTIVLNYQAAILHNRQHTAASLALNFSVIECLVNELFHAYGLLLGSLPLSFASKSINKNQVSRSKLKDMKLAGKLTHLKDCGLLDSYLYSRIEEARVARNDMMHAGDAVTPRTSGQCETVVRDLWALLIDGPFELNAGWTYRY